MKPNEITLKFKTKKCTIILQMKEKNMKLACHHKVFLSVTHSENSLSNCAHGNQRVGQIPHAALCVRYGSLQFCL